jgi:tetratricopeptide (TPR) repeat protein
LYDARLGATAGGGRGVVTKHIILFLAAQPHTTSELALGKECAAVERELRMTAHRDDFEFRAKWAVTVDEMMRHLIELRPSVIHFGGHGSGRELGCSSATTREIALAGATTVADCGIYLEGDQGEAQLVNARALTMMIKAAAASARVVVLNACYSDQQAEAVRTTVDCVVGMSGAIGDSAARAFAVAFYRALGNRCSVGNAVDHAIATLAAKQMPDEVLPRCVTRAGVNADEVFLEPLVTPSPPGFAGTGQDSRALVTVASSPGLGTHTFVGRERELADIVTLLTSSTDVQLRAALDGLPGIGKTELARQAVARLDRSKKFPGGIFWFDAANADLRMQWARLAEESGVTIPDLDARAGWAVQQVCQRAQQGETVLIVLDNVDSWEPRPSPLPDAAAIRMLVTTRARWLHNSFRPYEVPPLELEPSRQLLHAIVGHEITRADELLRALGGHVLSIEIAATYLREYGISPAEYLKRLAAGNSPGSSVADQTAYRATAERAFRLMWRRIGVELQRAWIVAAQLPPAWFSTELAEAIGLDAERRRGLVRLHILDRDDQGRNRMHRLLREFALAEWPASESVQEAVIRGATQLLQMGDGALSFQRYRRDSECFDHLALASENVAASARLKTACARALRQLDKLPAARALSEQALATALRTYGEDRPVRSKHRSNLTLVLGDLRGTVEQRAQFAQASPDLADDGGRQCAHPRKNLALVLKYLRSLPAGAVPPNLKAYGEDHPTIATARSNFALLLRSLGELSTARKLLAQALASDLRTYGECHPIVARDRNNLGLVLRDLGELPAARLLFKEALASDLKSYREDHPSVARDRNNLGLVLRDLGDLASARRLFEQALVSDLKTFGDGHPTVASRRNNLAWVLRDLGEPLAAWMLLDQALAVFIAAYGDKHSRVTQTRANLAALTKRAAASR